MQPGWASRSFGASVDPESVALRRPSSPASLLAEVKPYASFVLATDKPFPAAGVLDIWLTGSALTQASLTLSDSSGLRTTRRLPLVSVPAAGDGVARLLGPDAAGWSRLQVNLQELASTAAPPRPSQPNSWDGIIFADTSGQGFTLLLDDTNIVPATTAPAPAPSPEGGATCVGVACNPVLDAASVESDLVPVYGEDVGIADVSGGPAEVIARLEANVTAGQLAELCAELAGALQGARQQRFRGECTLGVPHGEATVQDIDAPVDWPYLSIVAETPVRWPRRLPRDPLGRSSSRTQHGQGLS
jgi:hypothetical protein